MDMFDLFGDKDEKIKRLEGMLVKKNQVIDRLTRERDLLYEHPNSPVKRLQAKLKELEEKNVSLKVQNKVLLKCEDQNILPIYKRLDNGDIIVDDYKRIPVVGNCEEKVVLKVFDDYRDGYTKGYAQGIEDERNDGKVCETLDLGCNSWVKVENGFVDTGSCKSTRVRIRLHNGLMHNETLMDFKGSEIEALICLLKEAKQYVR
jgi:hypothetical protein